ncbi:hypothetical protein Cgig2_025708 [Carnegiea gigantea]|uniref:Endonuclease/exonuclease/phosphatase domain-containing protein n=1 Tax=Carnegiea gigantea TaxID=171969 RepID=A0A9Q1K3T1_9CARY|nr:hypothetical protein Cgig2_025708 [Carnegiea gigantea]
MGFDHFDFVLSVNHAGGIWALWNNKNCHASILTKENRAIHMLVHDPDRGIAREGFANLYPSLCTNHGAFTCSDHYPIIISTVAEHRQHQPCPFRFQPFWTKYHMVDQIIYKNWQTTLNSAKMFRFMHKLKSIKNSIKPRAKSTFGNFQEKVKHNLDKINYVEDKLVENPTNIRLNNWLYWGRLARKDWLVKGDRNSSYFQRTANIRRKKQEITKIKDDAGDDELEGVGKSDSMEREGVLRGLVRDETYRQDN